MTNAKQSHPANTQPSPSPRTSEQKKVASDFMAADTPALTRTSHDIRLARLAFMMAQSNQSAMRNRRVDDGLTPHPILSLLCSAACAPLPTASRHKILRWTARLLNEAAQSRSRP